ncbi:SGNH/GDSL hydrolase family protein [Accumulibacter sp.]|uniref:SGNH/GDSL hydrolase family protein n=1 Tax=Accumulibacter sp. TaxID=2053492 RepID=UPI0028C4CFA5|nr:SGNH/GDSL hydrolase family protein [Accumulibacter sp.]
MQHILLYGDSLSWGIIPETRRRLSFDERWPGVMENALNAEGRRVRVVEDCLNGRRTVWEDPFKPGRKGIDGLAQRIEIHSPLTLVILMLGTNDFQSMHPHNAWHSAQGVGALVNAIRQAPIEPDMPVPPILIVAPPPQEEPRGAIAPKFVGGDRKCIGLAAACREVADMLGCHYFDAGTVASVSPVDGVHLDVDQHTRLGEAVAKMVAGLLPAFRP